VYVRPRLDLTLNCAGGKLTSMVAFISAGARGSASQPYDQITPGWPPGNVRGPDAVGGTEGLQ
jgi:hypothetical protein